MASFQHQDSCREDPPIERKFSVRRDAKIWNSRPEALKRMDRQRFRKDLRAWLQDNPFYSITEFFEWRPQNNP
ncbi:hypothetical protein J6590_089354 [Homalodisca vitripennis]|nr:hypothetical protein J6590_089354 [Homalodisca vitripennis]